MHTFHFEALNLSHEVIRALVAGKVVERIRQGSPALAEQLTDAASSVPANLGEGRRRVGRDRIQRFRIADGSAYETKVHLHTALAWGWIGEQELARALELVDRLCAMTWRLTH